MKSLALICLLVIVMLSCLEPNGENFVNIPTPDESTVTVNLNDYASGDTILVDAVTNFMYTVSPDHWISEVSAKLDEQNLYVAYTQFAINPLNYSKGVHRLFFHAIMRTDSRSLADMVSGEMMTVEREFIVIIENEPPAPPNLQLDTINGTLTLRWTKCEKKNFVSYVITKYCGSPDDDYYTSTCHTETITDKTITSWTDHEYVGRYARYYIEVATTLQSVIEDLELRWTPNLTTTIENGYATAHWRKPFFHANIAKVKVQYAWPSIEVPANDTSFVIPDRMRFGNQDLFTLDFIPATEYRHRMWYHYYKVGTDHSYPAAMPILYHPVAKRYYGYSYPAMVVMDEDLNVLESVGSDYAVPSLSDNSSYFITLLNGNFYYTDPYTLLGTELAYDPAEEFVGNFSVSDNGLLGYHSGAAYSVVDLNTGETKFNITWPGFEMITCSLSSSGKYLSYGGKKIYEYNGSTFVLKGELDQYYYGFQFLDNDNILISGQDFLKEYDINNLNVVTTYDLGFGGYYTNIMQDPVSHKVVCSQSGQFFVINTDTKKSYLVGGVSVLRLFNNTLFSANSLSFTSIDCSYIEQP